MDARESQEPISLSGLCTRFWSSLKDFFQDITTPKVPQPKLLKGTQDFAPAYCERSLGVLPKTSWVRKNIILVTHTRVFELVVLLAIAANCITLALDSNAPGFRTSPRGRQLRLADYVFTGFFTVEALLKILAMGLIAKPNTYLRSGWNILDVAIIATGYISIAGFANVTALRAIRALRPLRTITRLKEMRVVITSMVKSLPGLRDVTVLMAFYFAIFGTMFVLLFSGELQNRCGNPDFSLAYTDDNGVVQGVCYVVPDEAKGTICNQPDTDFVSWRNETGTGLVATGLQSSHGWAYDCDATPSEAHPYGQFCTPFKNPGAEDFPDNVTGYSTFDNILLSWVAVFQHVTMTDWSFVMYGVQDGVNWWTWLLHFFVCFMGGMLLINLIVAVIFMNFQKSLWGREEAPEDPEDLMWSSSQPDVDPDVSDRARGATSSGMMDNQFFSAQSSEVQSALSEQDSRLKEDSMSLADPPLKSLLKVGMEEDGESPRRQSSLPPLQQQPGQLLNGTVGPRGPAGPAAHRHTGQAGPVLEGIMCLRQQVRGGTRENARAEKAHAGKAGPVAEGTMHLEQQDSEGRRENARAEEAHVGKAGAVAEGSMHQEQQDGEGKRVEACGEKACVGKAGPVAEGSMRVGQESDKRSSAPNLPLLRAEAMAGEAAARGNKGEEQRAQSATANAVGEEAETGEGQQGEEKERKGLGPLEIELSNGLPLVGLFGPQGQRGNRIHRSRSAPRAPPWVCKSSDNACVHGKPINSSTGLSKVPPWRSIENKSSENASIHGKQSDSSTGLSKVPYRHCETIGKPAFKHLESLNTSEGRSTPAWMGKGMLPPFPDIADLQGLESDPNTPKAYSPSFLQYQTSLSTPKEYTGQHSKGHQQLALDLARGSDQDVNCSRCRFAWLWFRAACLRLATNPNFEFCTAIIICLNAVVLGLNWYLMPPKLERAMYVINYAFTCYFVVEIIVRITGRGINGFFFQTKYLRMNWFDFLITLASLVEMLVELIPGPHTAAFNGGLTAIRLLRLFRLARYWEGLNHILQILGHALSSGIYLLMLVLLFMFVMGLLGMQLFGYQNVWCGKVEGASQRCPPGEDCPAHRDCYVDCEPAQLGQWFEVEHSPYNGLAYCEQFPRNFVPNELGNDPTWPLTWAQVGKPQKLYQHFDDMLTAFLTVFVIITLDNWTDFMYPMMSIMTPWVAIYFIIVITLGSFMLLQLFLAILLTSLDKMNELGERKKNLGLKDKSMSLGHMLNKRVKQLSNSAFLRNTSLRNLSKMLLTPTERHQKQLRQQQQQQQQQQDRPLNFSLCGFQHSRSPARPTITISSAIPKPSSASASYPTLAGNHSCPPPQNCRNSKPHSPLACDHSCPPSQSWSSKAHNAQASAFNHTFTRSQDPTPSSVTSTATGVTAPSSFPPTPGFPSVTSGNQMPKTSSQKNLEAMDNGQSGRLCVLIPRTSARSGNKISPAGSIYTADEVPLPDDQSLPTTRFPSEQVQASLRPSAFLTPPDFSLDDGHPDVVLDEDMSLHGLSSDAALEKVQSVLVLSPKRGRRRSWGHGRSVPYWECSGPNLPLPPIPQQPQQQQPQQQPQQLQISLAGTSQLTPNVSSHLCVVNGMNSEGEHELWRGTKEALGLDGRPSQNAPHWGRATSFGSRMRDRQTLKRGVSFHPIPEKQQQELQQQQEQQQQEVQGPGCMQLEGRSCFCFGSRNWLRVFAAKVMSHRCTVYFVSAMVLLSCVILMLDVVSLDRTSTKAIVLRNLDAATTAIFGVEIILKCIHQGVLFNGPNSYLRNGWNQWDVFVVAISLVVLSIDASNVETFHWLRALRALRGLRVLHAASALEGINVVLLALRKLLPSLVNVLWVGLLFYYIFAVLAVALLGGKMHYCAEEGGDYIDPYYVLPQGETITKAWCERSDSKRNGPRTITTSHYHSEIGVAVPPYELLTSWTRDLRRFDNVVTALWVLYQMASVELWSDVMFKAQEATEIEQQPIRAANQHIGLFFVLFMFVGSLTVLNLIVGISINKFHELREESQGQSPLLTQEQQNWLTAQGLIADTELEDLTVPSDNKFRHFVHKLVYNKVTDAFMMLTIIGNMAVMFTAHYQMSSKFEQAIFLTNLIVTAIFFAEMIGKLIAIGFKTYSKNGWNIFDAIITLLSIMSVLIANLSKNNVGFLPVLRILRVVRIFRLIPRAKGLRKMLHTLYMSIPAVSNVAFVLLVFMYLWAIVGMNLFGNVRFTDNGSGLNRHANFRHFPVAMITEFRMLSGEDWNDIMLDCMQLEDCYKVLQGISVEVPDGDGNLTQVMLQEGQYLDPLDDRAIIEALPRDAWRDECSINPMLAVLYFCIFMLVCTYIMIQLVIGIVLDGIQMQSFLDDLDVGQDNIQDFVSAWLELDPHGTSSIHVKQLTSLLSKISPPLGVKGLPQETKSVQDIIMSVDIPLRKDSMAVHFTEVLHALAGRVMGAEIPEEEESTMCYRLMRKVPKGRPHYTAAHVYAAMAVSSAVRGFLQRKQLTVVWEQLGDVWEQLEEEGIVSTSGISKSNGVLPSADVLQKSFAMLGNLDEGMQGRLADVLQRERGLSATEARAQVQAIREASCVRMDNVNRLSQHFAHNMLLRQKS